MGPANAKQAYNYFAANTFPGQTTTLFDGTHWNDYGGYELAKFMASEVKKQNLPFAKFLADDFVSQSPSNPDPFSSTKFPFSPMLDGKFQTPDSATGACDTRKAADTQ